jgi:hypothetical protein
MDCTLSTYHRERSEQSPDDHERSE